MKIEDLALKVAGEMWQNGEQPEFYNKQIDFATRFLAAYAEQQEPVAEVSAGVLGDRLMWAFPESQGSVPVGTKLYAAPPLPVIPAHLCVVPKELSDKTSDLLGDTYGHPPRGWKITYARILAMIAAGEVKP